MKANQRPQQTWVPARSFILPLALVFASSLAANAAHAQEADVLSHGEWGARASWGAHSPVRNDEDIRGVSRSMAGTGDSQPVAERLRRLLAQPGSTLYLEINSERPFEVSVEPTRGDRLSIATARGVGPGVRGSISARLQQGVGQVAVLWINGAVLPEYVIEAPATLTHITLVVNGRVVLAEQPVDHRAGRTTIFNQ